jgi:hypothetical protein
MQEVWKDAKSLLKEKEAHMKEKSFLTMDLYKIRNLGESAEQQAQERRRRLEILRTRQEILNTLNNDLDQKDQEFMSEEALLSHKYRADEHRDREERWRSLNEESKDQLDKLTHTQIKAEMKKRIDALEVARQKKILEIEAARKQRLDKTAKTSQRSSYRLYESSAAFDSE